MFFRIKPNEDLEGRPMWAYARAYVGNQEWNWSAPVNRWRTNTLIGRATSALGKARKEAGLNASEKRGGSANH